MLCRPTLFAYHSIFIMQAKPVKHSSCEVIYLTLHPHCLQPQHRQQYSIGCASSIEYFSNTHRDTQMMAACLRSPQLGLESVFKLLSKAHSRNESTRAWRQDYRPWLRHGQGRMLTNIALSRLSFNSSRHTQMMAACLRSPQLGLESVFKLLSKAHSRNESTRTMRKDLRTWSRHAQGRMLRNITLWRLSLSSSGNKQMMAACLPSTNSTN